MKGFSFTQLVPPAVMVMSAAPLLAAEKATDDIGDIYGPVALPDPVNWPLYLALAAAIVAGIVLLVFLLKRRSSDKPVVVAPHTTALAELARARNLLEGGSSIDYAVCLSEILRGYIEARFAMRSTRQTTAEFLAELRRGEGQGAAALHPFAASLENCLHLCDLAKYAHMGADRTRLEEMETSVRVFIEDTMGEEC